MQVRKLVVTIVVNEGMSTPEGEAAFLTDTTNAMIESPYATSGLLYNIESQPVGYWHRERTDLYS